VHERSDEIDHDQAGATVFYLVCEAIDQSARVLVGEALDHVDEVDAAVDAMFVEEGEVLLLCEQLAS
jgi:hypothetical protein